MLTPRFFALDSIRQDGNPTSAYLRSDAFKRGHCGKKLSVQCLELQAKALRMKSGLTQQNVQLLKRGVYPRLEDRHPGIQVVKMSAQQPDHMHSFNGRGLP